MLNKQPSKILLATDLSSRCDRALDRAAQLAEEWQAELVALNVLESAQAPDMALTWAYGNEDTNLQIAQHQLENDLADISLKLKMRIAHGDVPSAIQTVAIEEHSDIVVTGMARNETFGRFLTGSTVEKLARSLTQPLLVVRNRTHDVYRKIVVATDFSESARYALQAAIDCFPQQPLCLYHAHSSPFAHASDGGKQLNDAGIQELFDAWLAGCELTEQSRAQIHCVAQMGALEKTLTQYVRAENVDLVVMGTHGDSGLLSVLLGSSAQRLLDWLPCDTMTVRDPRATG